MRMVLWLSVFLGAATGAPDAGNMPAPVFATVVRGQDGKVLLFGAHPANGTSLQIVTSSGDVVLAQVDEQAGPQGTAPASELTYEGTDEGVPLRLTGKGSVLVGIAVIGPGSIEKCGKSLCLRDQQVTRAQFRKCFSEEGIHLTVWAGKPLHSARLFHAYVGLGYDNDPSGVTCKKADFDQGT